MQISSIFSGCDSNMSPQKAYTQLFLFKVLQDNSIEGQGVTRLVTVVKKYDGLTTVDLSGKTPSIVIARI